MLGLPRDASVLIRGEAGYGKTTVALRRLKVLTESAGLGDTTRSIALVPTEGLLESVRASMNGLGLFDTEVRTVDEWIDAQARRAFPDVPTKQSRDATMSVIRMKRHPELRRVLPDALRALSRGRSARYWDLFHVFSDERLLGRVVELSDGELTPRMAKRVIEHACVQFDRIDEDDPTRFDVILTYDFRDIDEGTPDQDAGASTLR